VGATGVAVQEVSTRTLPGNGAVEGPGTKSTDNAGDVVSILTDTWT
jgi:hypothetical protein